MRQFEAGIEEVIAAKRVMRQSLFESESVPREATLVSQAAAWHRASTAYALTAAAAALIVALVALAVALFR